MGEIILRCWGVDGGAELRRGLCIIRIVAMLRRTYVFLREVIDVLQNLKEGL